MAAFLAHSANSFGRTHRLRDHLSSVAKLAYDFAGNSLWKEEAGLAGLLHDLGKYGDLFQARLRGEVSGLDHWSQGAWLALAQFHSLAAALAIQGHHIGLQSLKSIKHASIENLLLHHPLQLRLSDDDLSRLGRRLFDDGLSMEKPTHLLFTRLPRGRVDEMLDVRRLFSALVDADFLDTEAHFNGTAEGKNYRKAGPSLDAESALEVLLGHIYALEADSRASDDVLSVRKQLREECLAHAASPTGLFTLTAPTGAGKTLAMLAFALRHAQEHGLERIVMVIPYLTIIEQTANIYRAIFESFGANYVLEHHSLAGVGQEIAHEDADNPHDAALRQQRLLSENWDAPLILTTSVQMLESLFSNRPVACRKLHRLAKAVILFDEVQTLPAKLAVPTLSALSHLAKEWRSSVVFSTATQPAFTHLDDAVKQHCVAAWRPHEIVSRHRERLGKRVEFDWTCAETPMDWKIVAERIAGERSALCIVNLKRHAKALWEVLQGREGVLHLSTNMCPLHRQAVLDEVRQRLKDRLPCRLIATQCVEAGVDLDFPLVWRALAPLDALIQAAGRCNREGKMSRAGMTRVFLPQREGNERLYPDSAYAQATQITLTLLNELGQRFDPNDPELIDRYYRMLYTLADVKEFEPNLKRAIGEMEFQDVARYYRLIDRDAINVVVPWEPATETFQILQERGDRDGLTRGWIRDARALAVSLYRPQQHDVIWDSLLPVKLLRTKQRRPQDDWFMYAVERHYHEALGLVTPQNLNVWIG